MDSTHLIHVRFVEKMTDSFYELLCELEKSDSGTMDGPFMNKLRDIDRILQKLLEKSDSLAPSIHLTKQISTSNESIPPKIKIKKENISTSGDKKRKTPGGSLHRSQSDDMFKRLETYISRDVEGDDSDYEMKSVPVQSEDLFKTDYPKECFLPERKQEDEMSYQDVSSSLNKPLIVSIEDDPYIRKVNTEKQNFESNEDINGPNYPHIVKVIDDVYKCQLCSISNLPQNNVMPHVNGRQHKNALSKQAVEISKVIPKTKDVSSVMPPYECILCNTEIMCKENVLQHLQGRQHNRKLENARVNV